MASHDDDDEALRTLERAAAAGDPEAREELDRRRARTEGWLPSRGDVATCSECDTLGPAATFTNPMGVIHVARGHYVCADCDGRGEPVTLAEVELAEAQGVALAVNGGHPYGDGYDQGMVEGLREGPHGTEVLVDWEGSGDPDWTPLEGLRHGHPDLWAPADDED